MKKNLSAKKNIAIAIILMFCINLSAQTGYFRSKQTGDWNDIATWEYSATGSSWGNAIVTPKYTANVVTVLSVHTVTLTATDTIDQVVVDGKLIYADVFGSTPRINNGSGSDLIINGIFEDIGPNSISWVSGSTWSMGGAGTIIRTRNTSAGNWKDNYDGGISTIPATAYWIVRKTGSDDPTLSSAAGMYYPNLSIENNTGSTWVTPSLSSFSGSTAPPIVKGDMEVGGNGTGTVSFLNDNTNNTAVFVTGTLTLKSGSILRSHGTGFEVQGDLAINGTMNYSTGSGAFIFTGSNNQSVSTTGSIVFKNILLNKASTSATVTLANPAAIDGVCTFSTGYLITTSTNLLTFNNGSSVTGATSNSYISGSVKKIGNSAFDFPTGKSNNYQPISISAPSNTAAAYTAEYFHTSSGLGSARQGSLDSISDCEYWTLNNVGTVYPVFVTVGGNGLSCLSTTLDPKMLRLTWWNGTKWMDLGHRLTSSVSETSATKVASFGMFTRASSGGLHSLFLCAGGGVYQCGDNFGDAVPDLVPGTSAVTAVSAGGVTHNLAIVGPAGTVIAWGDNAWGELGNGTTADSYTIPVPVSGLTGIIAISAGNGHSLALRNDNTIWAWGYNTSGQLGSGSANTSPNMFPTQVLGLPPGIITAISAGDIHSLALIGGKVYGWGYNWDGQLGDGTSTERWLPVQEALGYSNVIAISAGLGNSLFLNNSGQMYATGFNSGQHGNGSTANTLTFVASSVMNGLGTYTSISAGGNMSLALKNDGTVRACGSSNFYGELGNGTNVTSLAVTQCVGLTCIKQISGGWFHAHAVNSSGVTYGWGLNTDGQIGDGSFTNRNTPVSVLATTCTAAVPPLVVTGINTVCLGSSTSLTVSAGIPPYTWAGAGLSSTTGVTVVATPTTTTTYTVTDVCSSTVTYTVTVLPKPTVTVNSPTICPGQTANLTAGGAVTYTWSAGATSTGVNTANASPLVTTTYTVTGTGANGCTNTAVATVTISPTVIVNSPTICNGATANLIASGANTYTWSAGATSSGVNTATASPSVTTTYTVTGTNTATGCTNTAVATVTVITLTVGVNSPTICNGVAANLTATGATTYLWSTGATINPITVSPAATMSYTVTGTLSGCTATAVSTVTVITVPASIAPGSVTIPSGGSTGLVASGGGTYSWLPVTGLSCTACNNPTASPSVTTTYTVTVTNSGCSATATSTVTVLTPCNVVLDYDLPNGTNSGTAFGAGVTISNKNIRVNGVFNIDRSITFSGCNFIMLASGATNAKINIITGNQLTMNEKTHVYSCTAMWDGIYVPSGGVLTLVGYAFIEDALNAVVSQNGGPYNIESCIFNRNWTTLDVQAYAGVHTGYIRNVVITSRNIPSNAVPSTNYTVGDVKTLLSTSSLAASNLRSPNTGSKSQYGVIGTDVNDIKIGYDGLLSIPSSTAFSALNVFDNLSRGIYLTRTNAKIYNNLFQYMPKAAACVGCGSINGTAVYAMGTTTGINTIIVGGLAAYQLNTFSDTYIAVDVNNYKSSIVRNNTILNATTLSGGPMVGVGSQGIKIMPAQNNAVEVVQNSMSNCANGIVISRNNVNSISTLSLIVNSNSITANSSGYSTNGIVVTDLLAGTTVVPTTSEIRDNIITESTNGISLSNVKKIINVTTNSITNKYAASGSINGIKATGCQTVIIANNHTKYNSTAGGVFPTGNLFAYGIYLDGSSNMIVKCNIIEDAGRSLVFRGTCTSPTASGFGITQNTMKRAQDGWVILNTGVIGTQGSSTVSSGNFWDLTVPFSRSETYAETNDVNLNSKLYMNPALTPYPTNNQTNIVFGTNNYLLGSGLNYSNGIPASCGYVPAFAPGGEEEMSMMGMESESSAGVSGNELEMALDSSELDVYSDESYWMQRKYVFGELKNNPALITSSALFDFYYSTGHNYTLFANIEDEIVNADYLAAEGINNAIIPVNTIEANQKFVNALILKQLIDPEYIYASGEQTALMDIAVQCPLSAGYLVYQARNLVMSIENRIIEFEDNCDASAIKRSLIINNNASVVSRSFNLSPNPSNGSMRLDYQIEESDIAFIEIRDLAGKIINTYSLPASNTQLQINRADLDNGVYLYNIIVNGKKVKGDKLVIIK